MTDWALQGQALYMGLKDKAFEALECDCGMGQEALVAHLLEGLPTWWPSGIARTQAERAAARAIHVTQERIAIVGRWD